MKQIKLGSLMLVLAMLVVAVSQSAQAMDDQWQASYYNNDSFSGAPAVTRVENGLDFDWGNGSPANWNQVAPDNFSARFVKTITLAGAGSLNLTAAADDSVTVYVDGRAVLTGNTADASTTVQLTAGTHEIRADYRETTGRAFVKVSASVNGGGAAAGPAGIQHEIPNLVAYYPFEEADGDQVFDAARSNTGLLVGRVPRVDGPIGRAVQPQGGLLLRIPQSAENAVGTSDFTFSAWVKTGDSTRLKVIFDKRVFRSNLERGFVTGYHLFLFDGQIGMQLADGRGTSPFCGAENPTCTNYITQNPRGFVADGAWHMITVTADRDSAEGLKFYVDGSLIDRFDITGRQGSLNSNGQDAMDWTFGPSGNPFGIDEIRLYDRALSEGEVSQLFWKRR